MAALERYLNLTLVPPYSADTNAWVDAVVSAGGSVSETQKGFVDSLVLELKANSNICPSGNLNDIMDRLYLFANNDGSKEQAIVSLVNPSAAVMTLTGFTTPTAGLGYTAGGSGFYMNTGFNPTSAAENFAQDSNSAWAGLQGGTIPADGVLYTWLGSSSTQTEFNMSAAAGVGYAGYRSSQTISSNAYFSVGTTVKRHVLGQRISSTLKEVYNNGNTTPSGQDNTATSTGLCNSNFFLFARNNGGSPDRYCAGSQQISYLGWGAKFSGAGAGALATAMNNYMTDLGHAIF